MMKKNILIVSMICVWLNAAFAGNNETYLLIQTDKTDQVEFQKSDMEKYECNEPSSQNLSKKYDLVTVRKLRLKHIFKGSDLFVLQLNTSSDVSLVEADYRKDPLVQNAFCYIPDNVDKIVANTPNDPLLQLKKQISNLQIHISPNS